MDLTVIEIKKALIDFTHKWSTFSGTERSASQTFLNGLIAAYTGKSDVFEVGARFEEFGTRDVGSGYMDLYWPNKVIFEMKRPSETDHLDRHRQQALEYWRNSADVELGISAPPYLVICSFHEFEVWKPGAFPNSPLDRFRLEDLPSRFDSLGFLANQEPRFGGDGPAVTEQAAELMVNLFRDLVSSGVSQKTAQRFIVQVVWELFAEDLGVVENRPLEQICRSLLVDESQTAATALYDLFQRLNTRDADARNAGLRSQVPYVNGELFSDSDRIHLDKHHLQAIVTASTFDWTKVNPAIFGKLLEVCMGPERREVLGAHYTSEVDILAVVRPTIVQPWLARLDAANSSSNLRKLYQEFLEYRVLDPAMGSGNFLAIAYRELRLIETHFHKKMAAFKGGQQGLDFGIYPITNLYGIEIDESAALLAKVTLWMTQALESYRYNRIHDVLPLDNLAENVLVADSLFVDWPKVDAIIGNPPYHGDRHLRGVLGDQGLENLRSVFGIGTVDYCIYFLRKAFDYLAEGSNLGFVLTNSVRSGKNLNAGLRYITENGGVITNAISELEWSGDANVTVSIVNIRKVPESSSAVLDGNVVTQISPTLRAEQDFGRTSMLASNSGMAFQGYIPLGKGWDVSLEEEQQMLGDKSIDYSQVLANFLTGDDLYAKPSVTPSSKKICFGRMSLEQAERYPLAMKIVRERVRPEREKFRSGHRNRLWEYWWQWAETRPALESASAKYDKIFGVVIHTVEPIPVWFKSSYKANHGIIVFPTDDDYLFGLIASSIHQTWAAEKSSSLGKSGRYLRDEVFMHFPLPDAKQETKEEIKRLAREFAVMRDLVAQEFQIGPRVIHQKLSEGGFREVGKARQALNAAVANAYGLRRTDLSDRTQVLRKLFDLNELQSGKLKQMSFGTTEDE